MDTEEFTRRSPGYMPGILNTVFSVGKGFIYDVGRGYLENIVMSVDYTQALVSQAPFQRALRKFCLIDGEGGHVRFLSPQNGFNSSFWCHLFLLYVTYIFAEKYGNCKFSEIDKRAKKRYKICCVQKTFHESMKGDTYDKKKHFMFTDRADSVVCDE